MCFWILAYFLLFCSVNTFLCGYGQLTLILNTSVWDRTSCIRDWPQTHSRLCPLYVGSTCLFHHTWFCLALGMEFKASGMLGKHYAWWATFLSVWRDPLGGYRITVSLKGKYWVSICSLLPHSLFCYQYLLRELDLCCIDVVTLWNLVTRNI